MMLLNGIISIVLLFALAEIDTGPSPNGDVHVIIESSHFTMNHDSQVSAKIWTYHPAAESVEIPVLLSLLTGALGSLTGYLGGAAHAGYQVSTAMLIGIRG